MSDPDMAADMITASVRGFLLDAGVNPETAMRLAGDLWDFMTQRPRAQIAFIARKTNAAGLSRPEVTEAAAEADRLATLPIGKWRRDWTDELLRNAPGPPAIQ